jgi:hypothetical protein
MSARSSTYRLPAADADKRAGHLDQFPASMIESLLPQNLHAGHQRASVGAVTSG